MKKVMTVDDSITVRKVLCETLSAAGYDVIEAVNGRDAISKLEAQPVDVLVTDLNMPELDGVGLIRHVRGVAGNRFLPIIMLTSETQPEKRQEGKDAGASGWITKPFKPAQLLTVMRMICPSI